MFAKRLFFCYSMYMKQELQDQLIAKYPKIFKYLGYIDCGDGWYTLIDTLCDSIQRLIDHKESMRVLDISHNERVQAALDGNLQPLKDYYAHLGNFDEWVDYSMKQGLSEVPDPIEQVVALQVKEKFGGLRFYVHGGNEYILGMIRMTERLSMATCEVCGNPGLRRSGNWISTLCDEHAKEK